MGVLIRELQQGRWMLARLDCGSEIVASISGLASDMGLTVGTFSVVGALSRAEIGFYDQSEHQYKKIVVDEPVEIASCLGNISLKDGKPFVHAHAVLSLSDCRTLGGHLNSGSVFAAEVSLTELTGSSLVREHDPLTGLFLWGNG
jgi:uncharacterized protein